MINLTMLYTVTGEGPDGLPQVLESGFEFEDRPHTPAEVDEVMRLFPHRSDAYGTPRWLSAEPAFDARTNLETQYSLHPGRDEFSRLYWESLFLQAA